MSKGYGKISFRAGIVFLLTGVVIAIVGNFRASENTNRINSSVATYIGIGLVVVGVARAISLLIFVLDRKKQP